MSKVVDREDPKSLSIYSAGKKIKIVAICIFVISALNFVWGPVFTDLEFKNPYDKKKLIDFFHGISTILSIYIVVLLFLIGRDLQDSAKEH
jgi:O-antigen/teichoic acid export membrane protein